MDQLNFIISEDLRKALEKIKSSDGIAKRILEIDKPLPDVDCNYLGIASDVIGNLSYLNAAKMNSLAVENYWLPNLRLGAKPSKVIEKLFKSEYTDFQKQNFSVALKTELIGESSEKNESDKIVIVKGDDIRKYYNEEYYTDKNDDNKEHSLQNSCMRYDDCSDFFDIYTKNEQHVNMAIIYCDDCKGKIKARCILWIDGENKYYDRVYFTTSAVGKMVQYKLEKLGYINISAKNEIKPASYTALSLKLDIGYSKLDKYPYMDTMVYLNGDYLSTDSNGDCIELQSTDGDYSDRDNDDNDDYDEDRVTCISCADTVNYGEANTLGRRSSHRDEYACSDCCVYSSHDSVYYLEDETLQLTNGDHVLEDDAVETYNGKYYLHSEVIELYNDDFAWENDDDLTCAEDGSYFIMGKHNEFEEIDGEYYNTEDDDRVIEHEGVWYLKDGDEYVNILAELEEEEN